MRKLIVLSLVFESVAAALVAVLIFTTPPLNQVGYAPGNPSAPYSITEDLRRSNQRLEDAHEKVRWSTMTMILISLVAQGIYLFSGKSKESGQTEDALKQSTH
mgnify:CR=1 FL=1|jgi:hypothetical protein